MSSFSSGSQLFATDAVQQQKVDCYIWNTDTLAWEAATGSLGAGGNVTVVNFPAVISGSSVPVSDTLADITSKYKISDIDPTEGNSYFGYVAADGAWYIMNLTAVAARYVKGDNGYIAAWAGKGALGYDYFYTTF